MRREWQDVTDHSIETSTENFCQTRALKWILELRIEGIDVDRQLSFAPEIVEDVFVRSEQMATRYTQTLRNRGEKALSLHVIDAVVDGFIGVQRGICPDRLAIAAPESVQ